MDTFHKSIIRVNQHVFLCCIITIILLIFDVFSIYLDKILTGCVDTFQGQRQPCISFVKSENIFYENVLFSLCVCVSTLNLPVYHGDADGTLSMTVQ